MLKKITIYLIIIIFSITFINRKILYSETKKKLFVNNITKKEGVRKEIPVKARDYITLSIFENFGESYQIITDDDIQVMYKQAEIMMASGVESENAVIQVANAINADEIIYGNIIKEGEMLRFTVHNLQRDNTSNDIGKKSFINLVFFESQMEWYCREIAKKLIKPDYGIDKSKAQSKIIAKFEVDDLKFEEYKGVSIRKITFESHDEITNKIVDDLMIIVEKGDKYFEEKDYDDALEEYRETIRLIGRKLRKETQNKIEPFVESVLERIAAVHTRDSEKQINVIDNWLKSQNPITMEALKTGKKNYEKLARSLLKVPSHEKIKMKPILYTIEDRLTSVNLSRVSIVEEKADLLYADYQFKKALAYYRAGSQYLNKCGVKNNKISDACERLNHKSKIARETGASWLENKVISYCNAAEYLNLKDETYKAKKYLSKAKRLIQSNEEFANKQMVNAYKETARIILR